MSWMEILKAAPSRNELASAKISMQALARMSGNLIEMLDEYMNDNAEELVTRRDIENFAIHAGNIQYETADLLISTGGDLREKRRKLFREACKRQGLNKTKIKESIESADMIFISVNTPTKTKGIGK